MSYAVSLGGTSKNPNLFVTRRTQNAHLPKAVGDAVLSVPSYSAFDLAACLPTGRQALTLRFLEAPYR